MDQIYNIGRLHFEIKCDWTGWYYTNRQGEQVNMSLFVGTIIPPELDAKLYQIVVGPLKLSWAWK